MALVKSTGNMYDWVTHMHTHLGGACLNKCAYCYVQTGRGKLSGKYSGPPRLIEKELGVNYGSSRVIFIEHMNDLFAFGVLPEWREKILFHARSYPQNKYVFQTKNPSLAFDGYLGRFPTTYLMGTTIETNRGTRGFSEAPPTLDRAFGISMFGANGVPTFITIEPVLDFDLDSMVQMIYLAQPSFVNIGADSKKCSLPEPSRDKVMALVDELGSRGIKVLKKHNLDRLTKDNAR